MIQVGVQYTSVFFFFLQVLFWGGAPTSYPDSLLNRNGSLQHTKEISYTFLKKEEYMSNKCPCESNCQCMHDLVVYIKPGVIFNCPCIANRSLGVYRSCYGYIAVLVPSFEFWDTCSRKLAVTIIKRLRSQSDRSRRIEKRNKLAWHPQSIAEELALLAVSGSLNHLIIIIWIGSRYCTCLDG